jgi:hypothetical protein
MMGADFQKGLMLTSFYLGVNTAFSIFATPNVFRYQAGPLIWMSAFTLLAYDYLFTGWNPSPAIQKE